MLANIPALLQITACAASIFGFVAMAELLGLISSIITITHTVVEGVRHTKAFYHAHREFEALQASITIKSRVLFLSFLHPPTVLRSHFR